MTRTKLLIKLLIELKKDKVKLITAIGVSIVFFILSYLAFLLGEVGRKTKNPNYLIFIIFLIVFILISSLVFFVKILIEQQKVSVDKAWTFFKVSLDLFPLVLIINTGIAYLNIHPWFFFFLNFLFFEVILISFLLKKEVEKNDKK